MRKGFLCKWANSIGFHRKFKDLLFIFLPPLFLLMPLAMRAGAVADLTSCISCGVDLSSRVGARACCSVL